MPSGKQSCPRARGRTWRIFAGAAVLAVTALTGLPLLTAPAAHANGVGLAHGDVLAATGSGQVKHFTPSGTLADTLDTGTAASFTTGMCFLSSGNLLVTDFSSNEISEFNPAGNLVTSTWATVPTIAESCTVDAHDNVYVGGPHTPDIYEFNSSGTLINTFPVTGGTGTGGTDWLDLSADQCTILYTGEGAEILSYNVCTHTQNADLATGLPAPCYELRIRPNGEIMLACSSEIVRLSSAGSVLQTYTVPGSSSVFAMNLDPDNTTFWTGDIGNGEVSHINIGTGAIITQFNSSPSTQLAGLAIVGQIVVSQPTITLSPPTASKTVGTSDTVTATITNPGGSINGQTVNFSVAGANTASGSAVTNSSGQATFTYTGTNTGTDTITATYGAATATATVTWSGVPPTTISTSLSGGGAQGATISVPPGTPVTDSATLSGTNAATAGGTVTYNVYSDSACTVSAGTGGTVTVTNGTVPGSNPVTLSTTGTYYWTASYSGDSGNGPSTSACGAEKETVAAVGKAPVVDTSCYEESTTSVLDSLTTTKNNELLVDYVSAAGPSTGGQTVTVSGSGLTWTKAAQENGAPGDTEVWTATVPAAGTTVNITAAATATGYHIVQTLVAYKNATGIGNIGTFTSNSGAPTGSIVTTAGNSWVWAAGFDASHAKGRTVGTGQNIFKQDVDSPADGTSWVQRTKAATPAAGTTVTINDTAPTTDNYNLILVEILG